MTEKTYYKMQDLKEIYSIVIERMSKGENLEQHEKYQIAVNTLENCYLDY